MEEEDGGMDDVVGAIVDIINGTDEINAEVRDLCARILGMGKKILSYKTHGEVSQWSAEVRKECAADLARLGSALQLETVGFAESFRKTFDVTNWRLLKVFRAVRWTGGLRSYLGALGLEQAHDMTIACLALYVLYESRVPFLDSVWDPLGLSAPPAMHNSRLKEIVRDIRLDESWSTQRYELWMTRRALATSLLASSLPDDDLDKELGNDAGFVSALITRIQLAAPLPAALRTPRRVQADSPAGRRSPSPRGRTRSRSGGPNRGLRAQLRRRMASPPSQPGPRPSLPAPPSPAAVPAAPVAVPAAAALPAAPAEGRRRKREEEEAAAAGDDPAKRRCTADGAIVRDGVILHNRCYVDIAGRPVRIDTLELLSLAQILSKLSDCAAVTGAMLQFKVADHLLVAAKPGRGVHADVQTHFALTALSVFSHTAKFAQELVDRKVVQRMHAAVATAVNSERRDAMLAAAAGQTLAQVLRHDTVADKLFAASEEAVGATADACSLLLKLPQASPLCAAANILKNVFKYPRVLAAFDHVPGLPLLLSALRDSVAEAEETEASSSKLASHGLGSALHKYLLPHLVSESEGLHGQKGRGAHRAASQPLLTSALEQLLQPVEGLNGLGVSLMTRERFRATARVEELGGVDTCLRFLIASQQWTQTSAADTALDILILLVTFPWLHLQIARYMAGSIGALSVLLSYCTAEGQQLANRHDDLSMKALAVLRLLVTPPSSDEQVLQDHSEVWHLFRTNDGVRVMLQVLRGGGPGGRPSTDDNRTLACHILQAVACQPVLRDMLSKLGVPQLLSELMQGSPSVPGAAGLRDFQRFTKAATALVRSLRLWAAPEGAAMTLMDHAVPRLERMAVVQCAAHRFSQRQLGAVVREWLVRAGMHETAATLRREAKLRPADPPLHNLDDIVTGFLKQQHLDCPRAISLLPEFSLRRGAQPALRAARHQPPPPRYTNVATRLFERQRGGTRGCRWRGMSLRALDRRLLYSRYRHYVVCYSPDARDITAVSTLSDDDTLLYGTASGSCAQYSLKSGNFVGQEFTAEPVTGFKCNPQGKVVAFWSPEEVTVRREGNLEDSKLELMGCAGLWGNAQQQLLLVTPPSRTGGVLWDVQAETTIVELPEQGTELDVVNPFNVACLDATDSLVLSNGTLWDLRQRHKPIHRIDKLQESRGIFAPSQNEIVIDKEVWDRRTFRLLQTVPALANTVPMVSPDGSAIFGMSTKLTANLSGFRGGETFSVVDGRSFAHIHTHVQTGAEWKDLSCFPSGAKLVGAMVSDDGNGPGTVGSIHVYEIGRTATADEKEDFQSQYYSGDEVEDEEMEEEEEEEEEEGGADGDLAMLADLLQGSGAELEEIEEGEEEESAESEVN